MYLSDQIMTLNGLRYIGENIDQIPKRQLAFVMESLSKDVFKLDTEPANFSLDILVEGYDSLISASEYLSHVPNYEKEFFKNNNLYCLKVNEFQSSWHVLKSAMDEKTFTQLNPNLRNEEFLNRLYSQPERFGFFQPREKAIISLSEIGWIDISKYTKWL